MTDIFNVVNKIYLYGFSDQLRDFSSMPVLSLRHCQALYESYFLKTCALYRSTGLKVAKRSWFHCSISKAIISSGADRQLTVKFHRIRKCLPTLPSLSHYYNFMKLKESIALRCSFLATPRFFWIGWSRTLPRTKRSSAYVGGYLRHAQMGFWDLTRIKLRTSRILFEAKRNNLESYSTDYYSIVNSYIQVT